MHRPSPEIRIGRPEGRHAAEQMPPATRGRPGSAAAAAHAAQSRLVGHGRRPDPIIAPCHAGAALFARSEARWRGESRSLSKAFKTNHFLLREAWETGASSGQGGEHGTAKFAASRAGTAISARQFRLPSSPRAEEVALAQCRSSGRGPYPARVIWPLSVSCPACSRRSRSHRGARDTGLQVNAAPVTEHPFCANLFFCSSRCARARSKGIQSLKKPSRASPSRDAAEKRRAAPMRLNCDSLPHCRSPCDTCDRACHAATAARHAQRVAAAQPVAGCVLGKNDRDIRARGSFGPADASTPRIGAMSRRRARKAIRA